MRSQVMSRYKSWLLMLVVGMIPVVGTAQTSCPWLNNATAAGALGGPVFLKMQKTGGNGSVCLFQHQQGNATYDLKIVVHDVKTISDEMTADESRCQMRAISLKGIGDEATLCTTDSKYLHGGLVIGRVRNKTFIVSVGSSLRMDRATSEMFQLKTRNIAEQVAGSLF